MPKVRTTINPTVELDVTERELRSLRADGLLLADADGITDADELTKLGEAQSLDREGPMDVNTIDPFGDDDSGLTVGDNDPNNEGMGPVNEPGDDSDVDATDNDEKE